MQIAHLEAEEKRLVLKRFGPEEVWELGRSMVETARARALAVAIDIRSQDQCLFHFATPGARPLNDLWARRKSNTAYQFRAASMLVTLRMRAQGRGDLSMHGLASDQYALSGGAVPIRVEGAGVVAIATVSGLAEEDDHGLVADALDKLVQGQTQS